MRTKLHYDISQVGSLLKNEIKGMLKSLLSEILSYQSFDKINFDHGYTVDGTLFTFKVRSVPLISELILKDTDKDPNVVTACTFVRNQPYSISVNKSDFEKPIEEVLSDNQLEMLTDQFINVIQTRMAYSFYFKEMEERIGNWVDDYSFESIKEYLDIELDLGYDKEGYLLIQYGEDGDYISKTEHYIKDDDNLIKNRDTFKRYLNQLVINNLKSGLVMSNQWSETLN